MHHLSRETINLKDLQSGYTLGVFYKRESLISCAEQKPSYILVGNLLRLHHIHRTGKTIDKSRRIASADFFILAMLPLCLRASFAPLQQKHSQEIGDLDKLLKPNCNRLVFMRNQKSIQAESKNSNLLNESQLRLTKITNKYMARR